MLVKEGRDRVREMRRSAWLDISRNYASPKILKDVVIIVTSKWCFFLAFLIHMPRS